jgi:membrane protein YqaA with SNARE-associated domain
MSLLAIGWGEAVAWCGSVGFGVVSAVIPVANAEAYVIATQMATGRAVPTAVAVGLGQSVGKTLLFLGVRRGRDLPLLRRRRAAARIESTKPVSPLRRRLRLVVATLLALVGTKRWGLPVVFLAAVVGLPPIYGVALLAGATTMATHWFFLTVLVGRVIRFVLLAMGVLSALWFLP